jgi:hypothetical protein
MAGEVCAALGIEPAGDESARWAAVLEAIRARRAASGVLGWVILDRNDQPYRAGSRPDDTVLFWSTASEAPVFVAQSLNELTESGYFTSRQPFRVVPVGPVQSVKSLGFLVIDSEDGRPATTFIRTKKEASERAGAQNKRCPGRFAVAEGFFVSPDRPEKASTIEGSEGESK